ncbi:hypothetical protein vseg_015531 [Gypsophila vaccaria]
MGCCVSRLDRQELVSRCNARKKFMKNFLHSRHSLSHSLSVYLRSLRSTGSSLLLFSSAESSLHLLPPLPPMPPPQQQLPMSPGSDTWTTTTTTTETNVTTMLPPPQPTWDFWYPFTGPRANVGPAARVAVEEAAELAVVVSRQGKELVEIIRELDEYFKNAANAASHVSHVLEVSTRLRHHHLSSPGKVSLWGGSGLGFGKLGEDSGMVVGKMEMINGNEGVNSNNNDVINVVDDGCTSHCATLERLYAWENKLFHEVKNAEKLRMEHEKRVEQLRRLEVKRGDYLKTLKTKKEVHKLESLLEVSSQAIQSTSNEIIKLRDIELYPQLLQLIKGFMFMWRSMYECHQVQTHIVDQLKYLNAIPSNEPTSEIHRQSTLQLEAELQQWYQSFTNLVKAQREYIHSLMGWLRLSLVQFNQSPLLMKSIQDSAIYSLCEQWQLEIDHVPDKVASEGIKSLLTTVHAIVVQQAEELKQKKRSETANKDLEKRAVELRALENKYGPYSFPETSSTRKGKDPVGDKRAKVDFLKRKAEEEKAKHEKAVGVTRAMTLNNLQMGLPHVFQAITGFSSVCTEGLEKVYNKSKNIDQEQPDVKRLTA